jgi:hypothetical protein
LGESGRPTPPSLPARGRRTTCSISGQLPHQDQCRLISKALHWRVKP